MKDYECISFVQNGPKAFLTFDRPNVLNALNNQLISEALHTLDRISVDARVLILRGAGNKAFAAGADIEEMQQRTPWSEIDSGLRRELARRLETASFPTVAAISSYALGGGLEIALACHLRIASSNARLGLPETRLGILPANGGTARLPRLTGRGRALRMILLDEQVDASEAERLGIINWVVSEEEFDEHIATLSEHLAPISTRAALNTVNGSQEMTLDQAIENEHRWFQICLGSKGKKEGVSTFLEKRKPVFTDQNDKETYL